MNTFFLLIFMISVSLQTYAYSNNTESTQANLNKTELQWSICEPAQDVYFKLTHSSEQQTNSHQIYFDTQDLELLKKGIRIYIRQTKNTVEMIIKASFNNKSDIPANFLKSDDIKCELNKYLIFEKNDCKIKSENGSESFTLSKKQIDFLNQLDVNLDSIEIENFGPFQYSEWSKINIQKFKVNLDTISDTDHEYVELSIRVPSDQRDDLMSQWTKYFQKQNITICETQFERSSKLLRAFF